MKLIVCTVILATTAIYCAHVLRPVRYEFTEDNVFIKRYDLANGSIEFYIPGVNPKPDWIIANTEHILEDKN